MRSSYKRLISSKQQSNKPTINKPTNQRTNKPSNQRTNAPQTNNQQIIKPTKQRTNKSTNFQALNRVEKSFLGWVNFLTDRNTFLIKLLIYYYLIIPFWATNQIPNNFGKSFLNQKKRLLHG